MNRSNLSAAVAVMAVLVYLNPVCGAEPDPYEVYIRTS